MKIDHDLRQVIKAAHKCQPPVTECMKRQIRDKAVDNFLAKRPATRARIRKLLKENSVLTAKLERCRESLSHILDPFGLMFGDGKVYLCQYSSDSRTQTFINAGGDLSALDKIGWEVDEVIAELAAADPKDARKILAKYGIRWE